jgi:hypothetical protein
MIGVKEGRGKRVKEGAENGKHLIQERQSQLNVFSPSPIQGQRTKGPN